MVVEIFDFTVSDSSLVGMLQKINSFTDVGFGGILGIFILIVVGGVLYLMMKGYGNEKSLSSLSVTMFVTSIIGLFLRLMGLISDYIFYICVILFVVGIVFLLKDAGQFEN